jgi:hypothetical protein
LIKKLQLSKIWKLRVQKKVELCNLLISEFSED